MSGKDYCVEHSAILELAGQIIGADFVEQLDHFLHELQGKHKIYIRFETT